MNLKTTIALALLLAAGAAAVLLQYSFAPPQAAVIESQRLARQVETARARRLLKTKS